MDDDAEAITRLLRTSAPQPEVSVTMEEIHTGARRRQVRTHLASAVGVVAVLGVVGGVSWATSQPSDHSTLSPIVAAPATTEVTRSTGADDGCPETQTYGNGVTAIVDWVDFLRLYGRTYTSAAWNTEGSRPPATKSDLGSVVAYVTCSISELTSSYDRKIVGPYLDGNAAYLHAGTPIYEVDGYKPECRVAVIVDGNVREYLAQRESDRHSQAEPCAMR